MIGDSAFGCFPMVTLCQKYGWHYLFRICAEQTCEHWSKDGRLQSTCPVSDLVNAPGKRFSGHIRLWQEPQIETNLSACWEPGEEEALLVISDKPAGASRINEYRLRWRVESTFQDFKSRGWDWERSHVRRLDRVAGSPSLRGKGWALPEQSERKKAGSSLNLVRKPTPRTGEPSLAKSAYQRR
jgi:hypothetical protein